MSRAGRGPLIQDDEPPGCSQRCWKRTKFRAVFSSGRITDQCKGCRFFGCQPKNRGRKPPQIIHLFIGFSIIINHPFWRVYPCFWKHPFHPTTKKVSIFQMLKVDNQQKKTHLRNEKNRGPLLSMKYWLVNRDPYNGLL